MAFLVELVNSIPDDSKSQRKIYRQIWKALKCEEDYSALESFDELSQWFLGINKINLNKEGEFETTIALNKLTSYWDMINICI